MTGARGRFAPGLRWLPSGTPQLGRPGLRREHWSENDRRAPAHHAPAETQAMRPATDLIDHKRGRMTSEERSLLRKAAADPKGQVAIKRARQTWHPDRERLDMLARCGHLLPLGERMGPHLGGTFAVWQITVAGRAVAERAGSARPEVRALS